MISNRDITKALLQNERVVSCQFLGKGIFLLRMEGDSLPMKTNSYGVMQVVDPERFNREFSPRNFVVGMDELEAAADAEYELYQNNWEKLESDDGHRELYIVK
jgi:hypothetical protein